VDYESPQPVKPYIKIIRMRLWGYRVEKVGFFEILRGGAVASCPNYVLQVARQPLETPPPPPRFGRRL
jgi:hypothetical protein